MSADARERIAAIEKILADSAGMKNPGPSLRAHFAEVAAEIDALYGPELRASREAPEIVTLRPTIRHTRAAPAPQADALERSGAFDERRWEDALEVLRDLEWDGPATDGYRSCPACRAYEDRGHAHDCRLARALTEAPAPPTTLTEASGGLPTVKATPEGPQITDYGRALLMDAARQSLPGAPPAGQEVREAFDEAAQHAASRYEKELVRKARAVFAALATSPAGQPTEVATESTPVLSAGQGEAPAGDEPLCPDCHGCGEVEDKPCGRCRGEGVDVYGGEAPAGPSETGPRAFPVDWPEDFTHENGDYLCKCHRCNRHFRGHKRRVTCRECASEGEAPAMKCQHCGGPLRLACADCAKPSFGEAPAEVREPYTARILTRLCNEAGSRNACPRLWEVCQEAIARVAELERATEAPGERERLEAMERIARTAIWFAAAAPWRQAPDLDVLKSVVSTNRHLVLRSPEAPQPETTEAEVES